MFNDIVQNLKQGETIVLVLTRNGSSIEMMTGPCSKPTWHVFDSIPPTAEPAPPEEKIIPLPEKPKLENFNEAYKKLQDELKVANPMAILVIEFQWAYEASFESAHALITASPDRATEGQVLRIQKGLQWERAATAVVAAGCQIFVAKRVGTTIQLTGEWTPPAPAAEPEPTPEPAKPEPKPFSNIIVAHVSDKPQKPMTGEDLVRKMVGAPAAEPALEPVKEPAPPAKIIPVKTKEQLRAEKAAEIAALRERLKAANGGQ